MLLQGLLPAHELLLLGNVSFPFDDAVEERIEKPLEPGVHRGDLGALAGREHRGGLSRLEFLRLQHGQHGVRHVFPQRVRRKESGDLRVEGFFSDEGLSAFARPALLGTAIVGVALLDLAGDGSPALGAMKEAEERLRRGRLLLRRIPPPFGEDRLRLVEQRFGYDWLVGAFVHFAGIAEMAVVDRIREHVRDGIPREALAEPGVDAMIGEEGTDVVQDHRAARIQLESLPHERRPLRVDDDSPGAVVVQVADKCEARIFAPANLFPEPSLGVLGERVDVVFAEAEFIVEHQLPLGRVLEPRAWKLESREFPYVEKVDDPAAIHAVPGQTVRVPCKNPGRLSSLDATEHGVENWPAWHLGRPLLDQFLDDRQVLALGKLAQLH